MADESLQQSIVDIVRRHDVAGGIAVKDVLTVLAHDADEDVIRDAIWLLLTDGRIQLNSHKRLVIMAPARAQDPLTPSKSGIYPAGPGDTLYNAYGDPVCIVQHVFVRDDTKQGGDPIEMQVRAVFTHLTSGREGTTMINARGEILGGTPGGCSDLDHFRLLVTIPQAVDSVCCPTCRVWLHRPETEEERLQRRKAEEQKWRDRSQERWDTYWKTKS